MRILQVCFSGSWGGLEITPYRICQSAERLGMDVSLACQPETPLWNVAQEKNLKSHSWPVRRYVDFRAIWRLARLYDKERYDVVHAHVARDLWKVVPAARLSRSKPFVIWTNHMGSRFSKKDPINRWVYSRLDLAMPVSDHALWRMRIGLPIPAEKTRRVYLGVDCGRFRATPQERAQIRSGLGVLGNDVVFGIVGRVEPAKGQKEFLQAAQRIAEGRRNVVFLIAGEIQPGQETYNRELQEIADFPSLKGKVRFLGHRSDIERVYGALDVFVMASYGETFGLVILEAMAAGLPVIATRAGGVPEIIHNEVNGLLVPPKDSSALAQAMERCILDPALRRRLADQGGQTGLGKFSWERYLQELKGIYDDLAARRSALPGRTP